MPDDSTTVHELRQMIRAFVAERQWEQFHAPKNLSMALAIEAAELMEHFQWISVDLSRELKNDPDKKAAVGEELADVLCYALALANELDLDVSSTMRAKMQKNIAKYPASDYQGKYGADDDGRR
jgi:NTP pyrophosphatase (non-canonical NTP hydrolase)